MKIHGTQKQPRSAGCRNGRLTLLACFTHSAPDPRGAPRSSFPELLESAGLPSPASASREASPGRKVGALRGSRDPQAPQSISPKTTGHRTGPCGTPAQTGATAGGGPEGLGWGHGLLGEGGSGFVQGGSTVGPVDQLALRGHDEGEGHAGLAGALGARVRHRHRAHASSCGHGRERGVGHGSGWVVGTGLLQGLMVEAPEG